MSRDLIKIQACNTDQHNAKLIDAACASLRNTALEQLRGGNFRGTVTVKLFFRNNRCAGRELTTTEHEK